MKARPFSAFMLILLFIVYLHVPVIHIFYDSFLIQMLTVTGGDKTPPLTGLPDNTRGFEILPTMGAS